MNFILKNFLFIEVLAVHVQNRTHQVMANVMVVLRLIVVVAVAVEAHHDHPKTINNLI